MSVKRYTGTFKVRDDVFDNITPNNVVQAPSGGVSSPAGEWKPAAWLPIVWTGDSSDDSFVISSGKVVSFDSEGRICPSGYRHVDRVGTITDTWITYVAADVAAGVINITTGDPVTAAVAYTCAQVATALLDRGLVMEAELDSQWAGTTGDYYDASLAADVALVIRNFISHPVGVCAYDVYCWAGDQFEDNVLTGASAGLNFHNYQKQHLVQFFTDVQMKVPHLTLSATTIDIHGVTAWTGGATSLQGTNFPSASEAGTDALQVDSGQLAGLARYDGVIEDGDNVHGFQLANTPVAGNNALSLWADASDTVAASYLLNQKNSIAALSATGDYFIDAPVGMLLVYAATPDTDPTSAATSLTYYYYAAGTWDTTGVMDRMIHIDGIVKPGDFITYDANSNFVAYKVHQDATAGTVEGGITATSSDYGLVSIIGRCLALVREPRGLLDRVETAFSGSSFSASAQMPGTATSGLSDLLTLSPEDVSDQVAILNIKVQ